MRDDNWMVDAWVAVQQLLFRHDELRNGLSVGDVTYRIRELIEERHELRTRLSAMEGYKEDWRALALERGRQLEALQEWKKHQKR